LFDFDSEVEPILEVLCAKLLEQSRMEVLEETELETQRHQRRTFEQQRNAELIEAQQLEAFETRRRLEIVRSSYFIIARTGAACSRRQPRSCCTRRIRR
jgi:hypothetical protein